MWRTESVHVLLRVLFIRCFWPFPIALQPEDKASRERWEAEGRSSRHLTKLFSYSDQGGSAIQTAIASCGGGSRACCVQAARDHATRACLRGKAPLIVPTGRHPGAGPVLCTLRRVA
eukprot:scaffold412_cov388-Prasinococcus_capsulatus_cf.AAC.52